MRQSIKNIINELGLDFEEVKENIEELRELKNKLGDYDFYIYINDCEYRFMHESAIWEIYVEGIKEITEDCYLENKIPSWLAIDWYETAENILSSDGYGNHFASYDGAELQADNYYIFRVN